MRGTNGIFWLEISYSCVVPLIRSTRFKSTVQALTGKLKAGGVKMELIEEVEKVNSGDRRCIAKAEAASMLTDCYQLA